MTAWALIGLASALLFGLSTPLSKTILPQLTQFQLAGLLYLGAGVSMIPFVLAGRGGRRRGRPGGDAIGASAESRPAGDAGGPRAVRRLSRTNALRLAGSVVFGGCAGPVLLLAGLGLARASSVSLWLTLELAATTLLGALFFKENLGRNGWLGMLAALAANVLIVAGEGSAGALPAVLVCLACVCWGLDNNLTALIDGLTPVQTTMAKGLAAGAVNLAIGCLAARGLPVPTAILPALGLGALSYGGSIVLYITAAQKIGAARSQILFATAPFFGVILSFLILGERPSWTHLAAIPVLAAAILLMLTGHHSHRHAHQGITHIHAHRHDDAHHTHVHPGLPPDAAHTHEHSHEAQVHEHPHLPDLHHRHTH